MESDRLCQSLARAWHRAVAVSCSEDLPREYVNVLLPLMPEIAPEFLRAHRDRGYAEGFLLMDHAALLARHAPEQFLERAFATQLPVSPVEIAARGALGVAPEAREPFRRRALAALAQTQDLAERAGALLAWSAVEPEPAADSMIDEALALLPELSPFWLARLARSFGATLATRHRGVLLAALDKHVATGDADLLLVVCAISPPAQQLARAHEAVERVMRAGEPSRLITTTLAAADIVGFAPMQAYFDRVLDGPVEGRDLLWMLRHVGASLPPETLDRIEARARHADVETWRRTMILAALARHHAARRPALLDELRALLARVVGDPVGGHRMGPEDISQYDNADMIRAIVAMTTSAALDGEERRALQRCALAIVERLDSGVERRYELPQLPWDDFGAALDEALQADAARVALGLRDRPSALAALGRLVGALPPAAQHLGLLGLARLADGAPPARLPHALTALESAAALPADALAPRGSPATADSGSPRWRRADEAALARLTEHVSRQRFAPEELRAICAALTPAAAERATDFVLAMQDHWHRREVAIVLAAAEPLRESTRRDALVAELIRADGDALRPHDAEPVARLVRTVRSGTEEIWAERVARFFDAHTWNAEDYLAWVAAFAPALRRFGGAACVAGLASRLREAPPVNEFARPWTGAVVGGFDA